MRFDSTDLPETPSEFFEVTLPGALRDAVRGVRKGSGAIAYAISSEERWSIWVEEGEVRSAHGRRADTVLEVTCVEGDWRELLALGKIEHGIAILTEDSVVDVLRSCTGTILRRITDRDLVVAETTGGVPPDVESPRLVLSMSLESHDRINEGQGIFVLGSGELQATGDLAMLAQLATVFG